MNEMNEKCSFCWCRLGSVAYANVDHQKFIGHGTNCLSLYMDVTCFRCFGNNLLSMQKYIADCHYARSF